MTTVVYVSGAPGSGKSTIAVPLAERLALPLLSKDVIKEQLFDSLPACVDDPVEWSRILGGAAMELLWTVARHAGSVVLEANFRPRSDFERSRLLSLDTPLVEVHCSCPAELAAGRYEKRARTRSRHAGAHPLVSLSATMLAEFDGPVGLGKLLVVDTAQSVDLPTVVNDIRALME